MRDSVPRLHVLGTTGLEPGGRAADALLAGSKRLGLLAYLVLARPRGFHRRDKLLPLFWPEHDQRAARNALSNLLHHVRRAIGDGVLENRGAEEVGVRAGRLWTDAVAFEEALCRGDARGALDLYRGDLLEGFHLRGAAPEFNDWLEGERGRLRARAADASWALAHEAERAGDGSGARSWARRAAALSPFSEEAHVRLLQLLDRAGDRAGALAAHAAFTRRLRDDLGVAPSDATQAVVERLRQAARAPGPASAPEAGAAGGPRALDPRRVAVLPFEVVAGSREAETFAAGLHLDVLTSLARVPALTVISRGSVLRTRQAGGGAASVGRALNAGTVVEGTVREVDGRLRLTVQFVDGRDGRVRWAETLDRTLSAAVVFDLQAELAERIAETAHGELADAALFPTGHGARPPDTLDAYLLHARGRVRLEQRTERGVRHALELFQEAAGHDPTYAAAWSGLAEARSLYDYYGYAPPPDAPDALGAALRALELDPTSGDALTALGVARAVRHEGAAAARAFEQAVRLAPGHGEAHCWLGWIHLVLGRPRAAIGPSERSAELDPLAPAVRAYLAEVYLANGRVAEAIEEARRARASQPDYGFAHFIEGVALYHAGRFEEARRALGEARPLARENGTPAPCDVDGILAVTQAAMGDRDRARRLLASRGAGIAAVLALAALGDTDGAVDALEGVDEWGPVATVQVRYLFPELLRPLRAHAQFEAVLQRVEASWTG